LTVIVPFGVTLQDCLAVPPEALVAVKVKLFAVRDCGAVGVHVRVLPESAAPLGAVERENVTAPPDGSVAAA